MKFTFWMANFEFHKFGKNTTKKIVLTLVLKIETTDDCSKSFVLLLVYNLIKSEGFTIKYNHLFLYNLHNYLNTNNLALFPHQKKAFFFLIVPKSTIFYKPIASIFQLL